MSGINLDNTTKANISTYFADVLLPDVLEGEARDIEGSADDLAGGIGLGSNIAGAILALVSPPSRILLGITVALIGSAIGEYLAGRASPAAARAQADKHYWYLVKRKVYCSLPNSTDPSVLTEAARNRIADEIENIVPYNQAAFSSKTSANLVLSGFIRGLELNDFKELLEASATQWVGNSNGVAALPQNSVECPTSPLALIPVIGDTGSIPFSERVSANTWRIGATAPGTYRWRTPFPDQCFRMDALTAIQSPVINPILSLVTYTQCDGFPQALNTLESLQGVCFRDLEISSGLPFELYVTISECGGQPASTHPTAFVRLGSDQQIVAEGQTATVPVTLLTHSPLTAPVTVVLALEGISTAVMGSDFTYQSPAQITFPIGAVSGTSELVSIHAMADGQTEPVEHIVLRLVNPSLGVTIIEPSLHVIALMDAMPEFFYNFRQGTQGWTIEELWGTGDDDTPTADFVPGEGLKVRPKDTNGNVRAINISRTFSTPATFSRIRLRYTALNADVPLIIGITRDGGNQPWQWFTPEGTTPTPPVPNDQNPGSNKLVDKTFDLIDNVTSLFIQVISQAPDRFDPNFWLHDLELL